jgi:hypothetical protein
VQEIKDKNIFEPISISIPMKIVGRINVNNRCFSSLFLPNKTIQS